MKTVINLISPNKPAAPNPAITVRFQIDHRWRRVGDRRRSAFELMNSA